jgi:hypothetical protein
MIYATNCSGDNKGEAAHHFVEMNPEKQAATNPEQARRHQVRNLNLD